jgi:DNA modification methylase
MSAGLQTELGSGEQLLRTESLTSGRGPVRARDADTREVRGGKGSVFFRAHSYHTKVPVEGLTKLVEHYTDPGDVIVDPFCGSGQTGLAALLTGRHAIISDLSPAAVHIARGYTTKVDPSLYRVTATKILEDLIDVEDLLYRGGSGRVEYRVWSDVYECPRCGDDILFWDAGVDAGTGKVTTDVCCPQGHGPFGKTGLRWVGSVPVQANISHAGERKREVIELHGADLSPVGRDDIGWWYPTAAWEGWREMWRAQHDALGITTAADFYTDRNLYGLAALWNSINQVDDHSLRAALRFTFTSTANRASRRYQWHPTRPTNVLSSTMYVAALNYEFNVFSLFRRKVSTIAEMYDRTWIAPGSCDVRQGSATDLSWLPDASIDYVFTDPPFGSNIYYADSSFLWEAWLGAQTDVAAEAVVNKRIGSDRGGKGLDGYESLMGNAMAEIARILRPNAWASLQFHNSDDSVWSSIQRAIETAGFTIGAAVVMDKGQASFKGLRHEGKGEKVANFDVVMHLHCGDQAARSDVSRGDVAAELARFMTTASPARRTTPSLHSVAMRYLLAEQADLEGWSYTAVEALCAELFDREGARWELRQ